MKRSLGVLCILLTFVLGFGTPARACSPIGWDFAKHFTVSKAVVYGRVTAVLNDGAKATLQVLAYSGPGTAPVVIDLPRTQMLRGGGNCPALHLKFKADSEYVVFLGGVPPNLRFADAFRTALLVDEKGHVQDMFNQTMVTLDLLHEFASGRGYTVQRPAPGAPHWVAGRTWVVVGVGAILILGFLVYRRRFTVRHK